MFEVLQFRSLTALCHTDSDNLSNKNNIPLFAFSILSDRLTSWAADWLKVGNQCGIMFLFLHFWFQLVDWGTFRGELENEEGIIATISKKIARATIILIVN